MCTIQYYRLFQLFTLVLLLFLCQSCNTDHNGKSKVFVFPEVIDTVPLAEAYYSPQMMAYAVHKVLTVRKIGTKADLTDTSPDYQYLNYELSNFPNQTIVRKGLEILVDTSRVMTIDIDGARLNKQTAQYIDSIFSSHARGTADATHYVRGYPVFIVNRTDSTVYFDISELQVLMIQEVLDSSKNWQPIECFEEPMCASSHGMLELRPGYYAMTNTFAYRGTFETWIRLKMVTQHGNIYSKPFRGSINPVQIADSALVSSRPRDFLIFDRKKSKH
ncbi:MAG: hypothetical protein JNL32_06375 [Candidatus Kapabacteria bacterium]|nr:hypothetical protein [Candidatus Kapabacteria bacterium]